MTLLINKSKQIYLIFASCIMLASCNQHKKVDVSHIDVDVKIERFDHDLNEMATKPMAQQAILMQKKYGAFYADFMERILPLGSTRDTAYFKALRQLFVNKDYMAVKREVDSIYPNTDKQDAALTDAFRRIKYYFPKKNLPKVYAYLSGFQTQIAVGDRYVAIGLDMFLGSKSKFYPAIVQSVPHYISQRFTADNVAPRVVERMITEDMYPEHDKDNTLLSRMIYSGKVMYFMDQVLPDVPDSTKIGYTTAQLQWCDTFKSNIWGYFLEENLLYETDEQKIQKYMGESPFTPGLGEKNESAPKLGVWTGWQIVRGYMDKNPKVTLPQLMADDDAQKILNSSKYRPKQSNK